MRMYIDGGIAYRPIQTLSDILVQYVQGKFQCGVFCPRNIFFPKSMREWAEKVKIKVKVI